MFRAEPWGRAFIAGCGEARVSCEDAYAALRVYCRAGLKVPGELSGLNDALRFGKAIDGALTSGAAGAATAAQFAETFFLLMVKKGHFRQFQKITREIEKRIDEKNGVVRSVLETPFDCTGKDGDAFVDSVKSIMAKKVNAKKMEIERRLAPDLIAGVRIRTGGKLYDGSLKTRLEQMTRDIGR
jgi:hypothetical protein